MTGTTTTYDRTILLSTTDNPTETCIAQDIFRRLPLEVQRDYGMYYELPDAETLSSEEICFCLCTTNSWIPAVEMKDHFRFITSKGLIAMKDVMDLVDILATLQEAEERQSAPLMVSNYALEPIILSGARDNNETLPDWLWNQAMKIQENHGRLQKEISESQRITRQAAADIFETQTTLVRETSHHAEMMNLISALVGAEAVHHYDERVLLMEQNIHPTSAAAHNAHYPRSTRVEGSNRVHSSPSRQSKTAHGSSDRQHFTGSSLKRSRGTYEEFVSHSSHTTPSAEERNPVHPAKKRRLNDCPDVDTGSSPTAHFSVMEGTILTNIYTSDDDDAQDKSSYSPSSGTESDIVDEEDIAEAATELFWGTNDSSASVNSLDEPGLKLRWNVSHAAEETDSDSSYTPPDWTYEQMLEALEKLGVYGNEPQIWEEGCFLDDVASRGPRSDSGLTSDDLEDDHYDVSTLHRSDRRPRSKSLGDLLRWNGTHIRMEYGLDREAYCHNNYAEFYTEYTRRRWRAMFPRLEDPIWMKVDVDARIADIVAREGWVFDDQQWRFFENPITLLCRLNHLDDEDRGQCSLVHRPKNLLLQ